MAMAHPSTADSRVVAVPREAFLAPTHSQKEKEASSWEPQSSQE